VTPPQSTASKNIVALALDDRMVLGFLVLAHATVRTAATPPFLIVAYFEGELSSKNQVFVDRFLQWLGVDYRLVAYVADPLFSERRHLTKTTFSKFVIADEVTTAHLWLDIDTIVVAGWDDIFQALRDAPPGVSLVVAEKIVSPHTKFEGFNAGVLGWTGYARKPWKEALAALPPKRFSSEQYLFNTLYLDTVSRVGCEYNFLSSWHEHLREHSSPRIVHFSGPVKPWHLHRVHVDAWEGINSTWKLWFHAEAVLLDEVAGTPLEKTLSKERRRALFSGRLHVGKGAGASWIMRVLALLGNLGSPLVGMIRARAKR